MSYDEPARWRLLQSPAYDASLSAFLALCREVNQYVHDVRMSRRDVPATYPVAPDRIAACDVFRHAHGHDDLKVHGLMIVPKATVGAVA